jgi:hypothetical protein
MLLLFERSNLDAIIILFVGTAVLQFKSRRFLSFTLIAISSLFKFYSAPLLVFFIFKGITKRISMLYFSAVSVLYFLMVLDFTTKPKKFEPIGVAISFGFEKWIYWSSKFGVTINSYLALLLSATLAVSLPVLLFKKGLFGILEVTHGLREYSMGYILFLICFFSGVTYDYRLTFLLLTVFLLIKYSSFSMRIRIALFASLALTMWLALALPELRILGDILINLWVGILAVPLFTTGRAALSPSNRVD